MNDMRTLQLRRMMDADGRGGAAAAGPDGPEDGASEVKRFDELLADKAYQAEFDRRVRKALETAKGKWAADHAAEVQRAAQEAEARARMTAEERAKADAEKAAHELAQREAAITRRELRAQALETLAAKGMPRELADSIPYTDTASCEAALEALEGAWKGAVEQGVNSRLRQSPPKAGGPVRSYDEMGDAEYYAMRAHERSKR